MQSKNLTRRDFLCVGSAAFCSFGMWAAGCKRKASKTAMPFPFPYMEVSGTPYECGLAMGKRFGRLVKEGIKRRQDWFDQLNSFASKNKAKRRQPFLDAGKKYFPEVLEELRGLADGSGSSFEDLMTLNLKAELEAMMKQAGDVPGCSTLALNHQGNMLLAHNEDGHDAYKDLMFLAKIAVTGKPAFLGLCYPGIIAGNGPCITEAGLVLTTNYIAGTRWRPGIPRYFLDRSVLNAWTLKQALQIACHPDRAFAFHFNIASIRDQKIMSVETCLDNKKVYEVEGLYVHTNHLVQPVLKNTPQDMSYVNSSSMPRYQVLTAKAKELKQNLSQVGKEDLLTALSSHEKAPYSPCRHPKDDVHGTTLATSIFDIRAGTWTLFPNNPCTSKPHVLRPFKFGSSI